jgi:hypothetical protein
MRTPRAAAACRGATAERFAQTFERAVADAIERDPEHRIGDPQWPLQCKVGILGDPRAPSDGSKVILSSETTVAFSPRSVTALPGANSTIRYAIGLRSTRARGWAPQPGVYGSR